MANCPAILTWVIIIALLIPIIPFAVIGELPGEHLLSGSDNNAFLFGVTGSGLLAADVLLPIPSSIVGTLLGARLGFITGWLWAWLGMTVGGIIGYYTGRLFLSKLGATLPQTPTLLIVFISRPVPVLAEAITFAAGATKVRFLPFMIANIIGNGIYALALAGNGATLLPESLTGLGLIIPLSLPVITWLLWRWWEKRKSLQEND